MAGNDLELSINYVATACFLQHVFAINNIIVKVSGPNRNKNNIIDLQKKKL